MRIGFNPHKDQKLSTTDFIHQVIVPVYIPHLENYFKDSLSILKICLESLFKTSHPKTYFTVANNGSCTEVVDYLNELYALHKIHEIIHVSAIGKLNSVLKSISGHKFDFITITDADVLYLNNWQTETYVVFKAFPKTGAVCPTPSSKSYKTHTVNIWFDLFFSKSLRFTSVKNPDALKMFAESIDNGDFYNRFHLSKYLTVSNKEIKAVVGAGHFATTYRGDIFYPMETNYTNYKLGGNSESDILDIPVVKKGLWRLSTEDNFTYHMGNVEESWMNEKLRELNTNTKVVFTYADFKTVGKSQISYWIKSKLFGKLILKNYFISLFLQYKGLSKEASRNYNR